MISFMLLLRRFHRAFAAVLRDPETRSLPIVTMSLLASGTIFYSEAEDWNLLDAFYFSVTTLTTVGMGDLAPTSDGAKVFTILYLAVGLGVLVAFATAMGHQLLVQSRPTDKDAKGEQRTGR